MTVAPEIREAYALDRSAIRKAFDRASMTYDQYAVLQTEVRQRLLERLEFVRIQPSLILDAGCGTGHGSRALLQRYRRGALIALDLSEGMLLQARKRRPLFRKMPLVCADAASIPLPDGSVDLIYSNLMLQWCTDLDAALAEFRRVLAPGGLLTFTTFGPDTLTELRHSWHSVDDDVHVNRFLDMHDIGDALIRSGLAEPVMDVDYFRTTYDRVLDLMKDLKAIGAHNVNRGRNHGLTSRRKLRALQAAYETYRSDGRLPATWEVIFGQAWGRQARGPASPDEIGVPVTAIGRRQSVDDG